MTQHQGLEALYRAEQPGLVRLATLLVRDQAVAEELVQDAFVRVHHRIAVADRPGAYLRTTVVNLCRSHGRRAGVEARASIDPPASTSPPPAIPLELTELWLALDRLPERQRHAIVLRFYLDLDDAEIARLLEARPGTVRSLISRGLSTLKQEVER